MDFMIRTKTGQMYRVPEDMFPIPARNMVALGTADMVDAREPTLLDKAKAIMGDAKQALHNMVEAKKIETAALRRDTQTAARVAPAARTIIDTSRGDQELDFSEV